MSFGVLEQMDTCDIYGFLKNFAISFEQRYLDKIKENFDRSCNRR